MPANRSTPVALALAAALVAVPLAGCIGNATPNPSPDGDGTTVTPTTVQPGEATPPPVGALAYDADPARTVIWRNGSFPAADAVSGQAGADDGNEHVVDVTRNVPVSIPVSVRAVVEWDQGSAPAETGQADVDVDVEGNLTVYAFEADDTGGRETEAVDLARFADEPVEVVVTADQAAAGTETAYTLRIEVTQDPHRVPADAPTAVQVPPEAAAIQAQPVDANASASLMAFDGADAFLGHHEADTGGTVRVPVDGAGEHVVMPNASTRLRLVDDEGDPVAGPQPLEALPYALAWSTARPLPVQGPATGTFEVDETPLAVAVRLEGSTDRGQTIDRFAFHVESPVGSVMDADFPCTPACQALGAAFGIEGTAVGPFGDADLVPGEHEVTAGYNRSTNLEMALGWVTYER